MQAYGSECPKVTIIIFMKNKVRELLKKKNTMLVYFYKVLIKLLQLIIYL